MELSRPQKDTAMPGPQCSLHAPFLVGEVGDFPVLPSKCLLKTGPSISDLFELYDSNKQQKSCLFWEPSLLKANTIVLFKDFPMYKGTKSQHSSHS